jgi:hypothetical protein
MKNPCDDCIIKMMCTAVCFNKKNFIKLVDDGLEKHRNTYVYGKRIKGSVLETYRKLSEFRIINNTDILRIEKRIYNNG